MPSAPRGFDLVELRDERRERIELGAVVVGPPVAQVAVAVELAALVVEAVPDLVADDGADAAVVDRVVGVASKNGGCRIAAGKTISFIPGCSRR
jgi:hypothetical protein